MISEARGLNELLMSIYFLQTEMNFPHLYGSTPLWSSRHWKNMAFAFFFHLVTAVQTHSTSQITRDHISLSNPELKVIICLGRRSSHFILPFLILLCRGQTLFLSARIFSITVLVLNTMSFTLSQSNTEEPRSQRYFVWSDYTYFFFF